MRAADLKKLTAPFPEASVSFRLGATNRRGGSVATRGQALAYIDARDVMHRLDDVCGPENWQTKISHANLKTVCEIGIKVDGEWIWKADGGGDTEFEAEKGAMSTALKRAAVQWGIGRYLYDMPAPWVDLDERGQIKDDEMPCLQEMLRYHSKARETALANDKPVTDKEVLDICNSFRKAANVRDFNLAREAAALLKPRMTQEQKELVTQDFTQAEERLSPANGNVRSNGHPQYRR